MSDRFNHLTYIYEFGPGSDISVDTSSFVNDFSEVRKEVIKQTPKVNVLYLKYPKGFEILMENYADKSIYQTNYPLKEISSGKYVIEFPND